jgi:UDP-glucose 4-epimerase
MKVLITGGAGYIGVELAIALNKRDDISEIIIYDNLWKDNYNIFLHSKIKRNKVKFIKGELLDSRKLRIALKDIDIVYHLAARVAARLVNASHHLYEQINNWGTAELVYAIEESNISKLIYTSSSTVYGNSNEIMSIKTKPYPRTYYGTSKLRGEEHVNRLMDKINAYTLRLGNVYGYGISMRFDTVLNKFMFDAAFKGRIKIFGTGEQYRNFIHINKVVNILENLIDTDIKSGIYNVLDANLSVNDLVDNIKTIYPETELLFVNQHLNLRNIKIENDDRIENICTYDKKDILTELKDFKAKLENSSM